MHAAQHACGTDLVGCAGWSVPRELSAFFPPGDSHLARYAAVFGAVEINTSFYRPHRTPTYARWAASVPPAFRFAVKIPRTITHDARLVNVGELLTQFASQGSALGGKLGCVLVQLPPGLAFDRAAADIFFTQLRAHFACMLACEARHATWFGAAATALLTAQGITRVQADPPAGHSGPHVPTTAASYLRLHGSPQMYYSAYPEAYLAQLRTVLQQRAGHAQADWVIFDNTAAGAAQPNALAVRGAQASAG